MVRRLIYFGVLILLGISLWFADQWFPEIYLKKAINTVFAFAFVYLIFKIVLEDKFIGRIRDSRTRYFFNKVFTTVYFIVFGLLLLAIWVEDLQAVLVGFGLIAAGLTIALQEVAKNFVGGLLILINNLYSVGDRIEINSKLGDVIDIGMFSTTIMETNEWVSGDQPTGRLSVIPNGQVLNSVVNNYTRDFNFIWDEITIPITYESDWRAAKSMIMEIVSKATNQMVIKAEEEIPTLERKYFFSKKSTEPDVYIKLTDNWLELTIRYITEARQRRKTRNHISLDILEKLQDAKNIKIASQTFDIVGFPELRLSKGETKKPETGISCLGYLDSGDD